MNCRSYGAKTALWREKAGFWRELTEVAREKTPVWRVNPGERRETRTTLYHACRVPRVTGWIWRETGAVWLEKPFERRET
ncbi:hypothetical protein [Bacillus marinisedimentorum]|uniref:hypothetical protein n=1 Tax=Bacillus marinisedimentorum TaxID=1821260 RepID=UPI000873210D|nr:hypothetical protein [Bacillus marinisedimentorum]